MKHWTVFLAIAALLVPEITGAQATSPSETDLQIERQHRRVIVRPATPVETIEHDAQDVAADVEQRQRQQEVVRDLQRPSRRRPDLDYDVKSGIQSQRLHDAVRR